MKTNNIVEGIVGCMGALETVTRGRGIQTHYCQQFLVQVGGLQWPGCVVLNLQLTRLHRIYAPSQSISLRVPN